MFAETVGAIAADLRAGRYTSTAVTEHYLERIARLDPTLNAYITVCADAARADAARADARLARGEGGPLTGVPYANKDLFCTRAVRTSCGSRMLDSFVAPYDATVVERLAAAGMVMLGKTNMDEFAMGSSNETSWYGPVRNPWDPARVPGGSSGGSAAVVAARLAPAATGTDTGGSIRQPAALCGITGLKPTYGRVSRWGMVAFASSLDQGGPMALTAADCALLLNSMAGHCARDSTSSERAVEDYTRLFGLSVSGLRIGLPRQYFADGLTPGVRTALEASVREFARLGAEILEIDLPHTRYAIPAYYVIASAECSSNLARYDGVRYGYRCRDPRDLLDLYARSRAEGFGAEVKRRIFVGTYALSAGYYDAYYRKAQQLRRLIQRDFMRAFDAVDVILGPTTPDTAFELGRQSDDPLRMSLTDVYTTAVNLAGLPALSMPAGFVDGLPVGAQLIGNYFDEARLLAVADRYQRQTDWHLARPSQI